VVRVKKISGSQSVILWRKRTKKKLIEYKGGGCELCGYSKCDSALQFHHKNPDEKDFSISGRSLSFDRLKNEVDKCMLVCSNCHAEIHEKLI
jgi:5-methylcytosine-specific restriction endonuclease McrA